MTRDQLHATLADALADIAPDADLTTLDPDAPFRDALDLDSMDFLALMRALHARLGVDIPEADYGRLDTLRHLLDELERRVPA